MIPKEAAQYLKEHGTSEPCHEEIWLKFQMFASKQGIGDDVDDYMPWFECFIAGGAAAIDLLP